MENELADYIFNYCGKFYNEKEHKARNHYFGTVKFGPRPDDAPGVKRAKEIFMTDDSEALKLLEDGYPQFVMNTAERIYKEHLSELNLNFCPKCHKIARTPLAKQCRFCRHNWHS